MEHTHDVVWIVPNDPSALLRGNLSGHIPDLLLVDPHPDAGRTKARDWRERLACASHEGRSTLVTHGVLSELRRLLLPIPNPVARVVRQLDLM